MKPKVRNPIAIANRLVNKPKVYRMKKGKGSYSRKNKNSSLSESSTKEVWSKTVKASSII